MNLKNRVATMDGHKIAVIAKLLYGTFQVLKSKVPLRPREFSLPRSTNKAEHLVLMKPALQLLSFQ